MTRGFAALCVAALGFTSAAACGKSETTGSADAGPTGPTKVTVKWTFTGKAASAEECSARGVEEVYVAMNGTLDPELRSTKFVTCSKGSADFGSPLIEKLGQPFIEASLLDAKGASIAVLGQLVTPTPTATEVTLDFFPAMNTGGASTSSSSSSTSASSAASTSGMGGTGGTGGTGGAGTGGSTSTSSGAGGMTGGAGGA